MRTIVFVLLASILQSCFYKPYYKNEEWWYFEEWDTNNDSILDKREFTEAFKKYKIDKRIPLDDAFVSADDNKDDKLTGLEFYKWEVTL